MNPADIAVPKALFFRCGGFSHANARILEQLRHAFPGFQIDDVDLKTAALRPWSLVSAGCSVIAAYGPRKLALRRDPVDALIQSPSGFRLLRNEARRRTAKGRYSFTFQTQSMFDASSPSVPHFVYTDHTERANLGYPAYDRRKYLGAWWLALEQEIYENASKVFTMSRHITQSLIGDYQCPPDKVECVFAGSNSSVSSTPRSSSPPDPVILFVGVDWSRKGGPQLLEAFLRIRSQHPNAKLRIVGCSPRLSAPGCEIVGRVPLADMPAIYKDATIFCMPTLIEPFGIAFVEAMHAGLPIVGTDIGAVPDFVKNGENGFCVPVGNVPALAEALSRLLLDPQLAIQMGLASSRVARERYTWASVGSRLARAIRERLRDFSPVREALY